ncbi:hypothetical protein C922_05522 [Plasmodium inui San Antonio 1]|uniref:Uncharacterized protein n=1 Tax=Plasmodium inui San Antonio 1 TaxID=1237626 RepID=W6ZXV6_9APIC|nr:hypothetical protein C922_05522 [Plasmodium inui San Antonio 1]EUD64095.1 hypothetical protein C922_05522 [Plasmodium inui San Antonio 1]
MGRNKSEGGRGNDREIKTQDPGTGEGNAHLTWRKLRWTRLKQREGTPPPKRDKTAKTGERYKHMKMNEGRVKDPPGQ